MQNAVCTDGRCHGMFTRSALLGKLGGAEIAISDEMIARIQMWQRMIEGKAPWVFLGKGQEVFSLGIENAICREFLNIVLSEMETSLANEIIDPHYQRAISLLPDNFQQGLALGCMIIKPLADTGMFEFISAADIIPLEYASDGTLRDCALIQTKRISETESYYRIERHRLTSEGLLIVNKAYRGTSENGGSMLGTEIPLTDIEEWAMLYPEVTYPGMDRMDFGFYRNPLPNYIDRSKQGVSIFESCMDLVKKCDIQFSRIYWEYESSERMILADWAFFDGRQGHFHLPKGKERLFVGTEGDEQYQEFSPSVRDVSYIAGLNEYLRRIEFNAGLSYGDLSKNEQIEKTAQEIMAAKNRKYNMVNSIQANLKKCLEGLAYAIAFYYAQYTVDPGFECVFHDSIKTDEEAERAQDRLDMASGIMSPVE